MVHKLQVFLCFILMFRNDERRFYGARVLVTPIDSASLVRSAKLSVKASSGANTRAFAKRFVK